MIAHQPVEVEKPERSAALRGAYLGRKDDADRHAGPDVGVTTKQPDNDGVIGDAAARGLLGQGHRVYGSLQLPSVQGLNRHGHLLTRLDLADQVLVHVVGLHLVTAEIPYGSHRGAWHERVTKMGAQPMTVPVHGATR